MSEFFERRFDNAWNSRERLESPACLIFFFLNFFNWNCEQNFFGGVSCKNFPKRRQLKKNLRTKFMGVLVNNGKSLLIFFNRGITDSLNFLFDNTDLID